MTMKMVNNLNIGDIVGTENIKNNSDVQIELLDSNVSHIYQWANIPSRYAHADFKAINPIQEKLVSIFNINFQGKNFKDIKDILIYGSVGTGKTHLTIGFLHKLIKANVYCRYATEHHLLDLHSQKRYSEFEGFKKVSILVIDELGKRDLIDWQKIQLEELISYRYNEMLPTIYITNMELEEFKTFVGDRVTDRLRENKVIRVLLNGKSLRGEKI